MYFVAACASIAVLLGFCGYLIFKLGRKNRRNHTLLKQAGDAVVVISEKGVVLHASASVQNVLGYSIKQVKSMDIASIAHPDDLASLSKVMTEVMARPGIAIRGHTGRMLHGDGSWHWYEAVVTNMLHDPDIRGIVDNFRDVSQTVAAELNSRNANRLYSFISQINQSIVQTEGENDLFAETCKVAAEHGGFKMAWIGLFNEDMSRVSLVKENGIPADALAKFSDTEVWQGGPMYQVLKTGKAYVCNDIEGFHHPSWREFAVSNGICSFIVLPLSRDGDVMGTLNLYSSSLNLFNSQEYKLLEEVARDISFALNAIGRERSRKMTEKRLRDSELRLKQAQSIANVGSFEIDFSTGLSTWSEELCRIYGFEITNNSHPYLDWFSMVHPDDIDHVREVTMEARQSLKPSAIYHRIIRLDGSIRHIFSQGEYDLDELGRPLGMHGVANDITSIKESEGARFQTEQNLQLIMDLIPQGIFIKDLEGKYHFVNESFASMYGVTAAEFLADDSHQQVEMSQQINLFLHQDRQVIESGETLTIPEAVFTGSDGSNRYFYTVKVPYMLPGNIGRGMIGIALEITHQKQADIERTKMMGDLISRNKELEQFSYVVSHNVRAPLVNIISLISLLDPSGRCEDEEVLLALGESAAKLDSVILDLNFILNMSHQLTEATEHVDFAALTEDIKFSIANLIQDSGVKVSSDFTQAAGALCIKSYMYSIFYNLILNSIKYRRSDVSPTLHVRSSKKNGKLLLEFTDNGLGIDLEKFKGDIFGLYKRFHPGIEGKGLGLYMVKVQVEKLKGSISLTSEVGVGTTFKIIFK